MDVVLGIDIGGTNTVFGLVQKNGNVVLKSQIETRAIEGPEKLFGRLFINIREAIDNYGEILSIKGIGIGAPNANFYAATIENPPNLGWGLVQVDSMVQKFHNVPVVVTNDANAAALGEKLFGAAKEYAHFIEITLGTGMGSGIVVDNQLLLGHDGFAGELGHTTLVEEGRLCGCGKKGCLETYVSATGLKRTVFELLAESNVPSPLRDVSFNALTSKDVYEIAKQGDALAIEALQRTGRLLGKALADAVNILSPEAVVLFGGLAAAADFLIPQIKSSLEENVFRAFQNKVEIAVSTLPPGDAAILGAAAVCWNELN